MGLLKYIETYFSSTVFSLLLFNLLLQTSTIRDFYFVFFNILNAGYSTFLGWFLKYFFSVLFISIRLFLFYLFCVRTKHTFQHIFILLFCESPISKTNNIVRVFVLINTHTFFFNSVLVQCIYILFLCYFHNVY